MSLNHKYFFIVICCLILPATILSQEQLSLEQAIDIALKNNYDISIVKNSATIAANNNTIGNAGMLPKVDLQGGIDLSNNSIKQDRANGEVINRNNVKSQNTNAGIFLNWVLFDGFKMFASYKRLQALEAMGLLSVKIQIENTVSEIILTYYNVVRQKQLIKGLSENIAISEERLKIAQKKFEIGSGSKLDVLQAQVDMNQQTSNLYRQQTILAQFKIALNQLLVRNADTDFDVAEIIPVEFQLKYEDLKTSAISNNNDLIYTQRSIELSKNLLRETQSQLFPKLNFNSSYLFSRNQNPTGFAVLSQNLGLNFGFTASWTIFNGFNTQSQIKNAKLQLENSTLTYNITKTKIESQLLSAFKKFQDDEKILALEEANLKLAKEALTIALERFRIGSSTTLELKEIQKSYDDALMRLTEARYTAKVSETQLMKLNGKLIK